MLESFANRALRRPWIVASSSPEHLSGKPATRSQSVSNSLVVAGLASSGNASRDQILYHPRQRLPAILLGAAEDLQKLFFSGQQPEQ